MMTIPEMERYTVNQFAALARELDCSVAKAKYMAATYCYANADEIREAFSGDDQVIVDES